MGIQLLSQNLRAYRESQGLTQGQMADLMGIPRNTWNGYERATSTPSLKDFMDICARLQMSEFDILHKEYIEGVENLGIKTDELTVKTPLKSGHKGGTKSRSLAESGKKNATEGVSSRGFAQVNAHPTAQATGKKGAFPPIEVQEQPGLYIQKMPVIVTVNQQGIDNIIYVPIKARAGYLLGYGDPSFIEELPSFQMPGLSNKTYRMFEVEGISMTPTLSDKDRVICEWVSSLSEIRENRVHVIVTKDGLLIKRVLNRVKERSKLYLKSDTLTHRADHPLIELDPEDVVEIWYVRLKVSSDLSEPSEVYTRLADLEINQHEMMKKMGLKIGN